jgi:hypothetical protein
MSYADKYICLGPVLMKTRIMQKQIVDFRKNVINTKPLEIWLLCYFLLFTFYQGGQAVA